MRLNPTTAWLMFYIAVNLLAAIMIWNSGELIGDVAGSALTSIETLVWVTASVVVSYILILGPLFNFMSNIKMPRISFDIDNSKLGERIGLLLCFLQLGFMFFNWVENVNMAGSNNERSTSPFSLVWVLIPVDALFIIYYGMYSDNKYFKFNLVIWVLSNLLRGWTGFVLFIIFFEWCRAIYNGKVNFLRVISVTSIVLMLYPLLLISKWVIRSQGGEETSLLLESLEGGLEVYFLLVYQGIEQIIGRLQVVSMVVETARLSDVLQSEFLNGNIMPFWKEGLHGIIYDRVFLNDKILSIGVAFTQFADFNWSFEVGDWNTNIGYVGWFAIAPYLAPVYILYTFLLGLVSFFLLRLIGQSDLSENMLWYIWLAYLMPPWPGAFINFLYALCVFLVIKMALSRLPSARIFPLRREE